MQTVTEFQVHDGLITETYSVERDEDGIYIFCERGEDSGPLDMFHIDRRAASRIALALLNEEKKEDPNQLVIPFQAERVRLRRMWA